VPSIYYSSAREGHDKIVKLLLDVARVGPSVGNNNGGNCLHNSALCRRVDIVRVLLHARRIDLDDIDNKELNNGKSVSRYAILKIIT
jgi:ankyrin repeat protein